MARRFSFILLLALLVGFSSGARAGFAWDTLWVKQYPYSVNKLIPRAGDNYTYGFIYDYDNQNIKGLIKFSDENGDSLENISKSDIKNVYYSPQFINDTNYIIGNQGNTYASIYDLRTGEEKAIRSENDYLIGYLTELNAVILTVDGYLDLYSLDSNKVIRSNMYKYPSHYGSYPKNGKCFLSPKGTYICRLAYGPPLAEPQLMLYNDYIINTSDLSYRYILIDTITHNYQDDNLHSSEAVFNDQETLLALISYNDYYIDFFDLPNNRFLKRITFDYEVEFLPFMFDSTSSYFIFGTIYNTIFYNIVNQRIDYISDRFPIRGERVPFTNTLYSCQSMVQTKQNLHDLTSSVYDSSFYTCNVSTNANAISITSNVLTEIGSIKVFDSMGKIIFSSENTIYTPYNMNISLDIGVYFVILNINGKNEYHKILISR